MKNFACLILGMGLLVNATMANLNENDAIDRVKRGSLKWKVYEAKNISSAKQSFIVAQIKKLYGGVKDGTDKGKVATKIRDAVKKQYGGKYVVLGCETDEFCSLSQSDMIWSEVFQGFYGQTWWFIVKV